jgi:hypothetical protein
MLRSRDAGTALARCQCCPRAMLVLPSCDAGAALVRCWCCARAMLVLPRGVLVPSELKFCCLPSELLEVEHAVVHRGAHVEALHHRLRTPPHTVHSPKYIRIQPRRNTAHRTPRTAHRALCTETFTAHRTPHTRILCPSCRVVRATAYRAPIVPTAPAAALPPYPLATHCRHLDVVGQGLQFVGRLLQPARVQRAVHRDPRPRWGRAWSVGRVHVSRASRSLHSLVTPATSRCMLQRARHPVRGAPVPGTHSRT